MLPLYDTIPSTRTPVVRNVLILLNVLVFFYELSLGPHVQVLIRTLGVIPLEYTHGVDLPPPSPPYGTTLFTSMFLHGGWGHLLGNMLYLWIFGDNVEDRMGHGRFLLFYLLSGLVAAWVQILVHPTSTVPMIGASGAISGVLGAYFVYFPTAGVVSLVPLFYFYRLMVVPAFVLLGFWFVLQFFQGVLSLPFATGGGVAFFAHIGGFVAGMVLARWFDRWRVQRGMDLDLWA
jgi:membrane associated rhomboid family serine protease